MEELKAPPFDLGNQIANQASCSLEEGDVPVGAGAPLVEGSTITVKVTFGHRETDSARHKGYRRASKRKRSSGDGQR